MCFNIGAMRAGGNHYAGSLYLNKKGRSQGAAKVIARMVDQAERKGMALQTYAAIAKCLYVAGGKAGRRARLGRMITSPPDI